MRSRRSRLRVSNFFSHRALSQIAEQQARWAALREIDVDRDGATRRLEDNLLEPLSPAAARVSTAASAQDAAPGKPQTLARLDSTRALIANVFDHWTDRNCAPLLDALGRSAQQSTLEWTRPMLRHAGSEVSIAAADLFLDVQDAEDVRPIAIVASFTEPYLSGGAGPALAFPGFRDPGVWERLQGCRNLALDRASNSSRFQRLAVSPLLERSLALHTHFGNRGFQLIYLWYEVPGHAALEMRREIDRFRMRVGGEIDFLSLTWQEFFARVAAQAGDHKGYADRVCARYFSP